MDWLRHPRIARERGRILKLIREDEYDFLSIKKVIFLCGGFESPRRDDLNAYLIKYRNEAIVFYAEAVWNVIALRNPSLNALAVEAKLASLADIVIVIVESPGTFAEIGAFGISNQLRAKLLPVLDEQYRTGSSFLETGPVRWVDADSEFKPSIWTDLTRILTCTSEIDDRLARIKKALPTRVKNVAASPKHFLFFVCDLVAVFGPCPRSHVADAVVALLGPGSDAEIDLYVALGKAMGLLQSFPFEGDELFFRRLENGTLPSFHRTRHLVDLTTLRAEMLAAMQACPECRPALAELARH